MCEIPQPVPSMKSPKLKRGERQTPSVQEWTGLRGKSARERELQHNNGWLEGPGQQPLLAGVPQGRLPCRQLVDAWMY